MAMNGNTGIFVAALVCVYFQVVESLQCYSCSSLKTAKGCQKISQCGLDQVCMLRRTIDNRTQEILYESRCETKLECDKELERYRAILTALVGRKREMVQVLAGDVCLIQCCDQDLCNNGCIKTTTPPQTVSAIVGPSSKPPLPTFDTALPTSSTSGKPRLPTFDTALPTSSTSGKPPLPTFDTALATSSTSGSSFTQDSFTDLTSSRKILVPTKPPKTSTKLTSQKTTSTSSHSNHGFHVSSVSATSLISTPASPNWTPTTSPLQVDTSNMYVGSTKGQSTQSISGQTHPSSSMDPNALNTRTTVLPVSSTAMQTLRTIVPTKYVHSNQSTTSSISPLSISQTRPTVLSTEYTSNKFVQTTTQLPSKPDCPDGWVAFDISCYKFVKHEMSFRDAKNYCAKHQAHLVHVNSVRENEFLKTQLANVNHGPAQFWIGITDEETENVWKFYDNGKVTNFYDWSAGEPDGTQTFDGNANADCAVFDPFLNFQWRDEDCSPYQFSDPICEMG